MARYIALVDVSEDGAFGVSFPDLPGCVAMGDTEEEAISNAAEVLAEWIGFRMSRGAAIPAPRSTAETLADQEVREQLGGRAALVMIPVLVDTGKLAKANVSMDSGLLADIDEAARRLGVTRSAFLAAAAREKIKAIA